MGRPRVLTEEERREHKRGWDIAWRANNLDRARMNGRMDYHLRRKLLPAAAERLREGNLRKFGISIADYDALAETQGGVCAVCRECETATRNGQVKRLAVDHDHQTGRNRGLLCQRCNTFIGQARDRRELLAAADKYLAAEGEI